MPTYAYETITVSTASIGPTVATRDGGASLVDRITIDVQGAAIRLRVDGVAPTASVGIVIPAGTTFEISGTADCKNLLMIRKDAADATVGVNYENG